MPQFLKNIGDLFSNKPTTYDPTKEALFAQALAQSQQPAARDDWGQSIGGLAQALLGSRGLKQQGQARQRQETEAADLATQDQLAKDAEFARVLTSQGIPGVTPENASVYRDNKNVTDEALRRSSPAEEPVPKTIKGADGRNYWQNGPNQGQLVLPDVQAPEPDRPTIAQDGRQYYQDTGEPVLPNVERPEAQPRTIKGADGKNYWLDGPNEGQQVLPNVNAPAEAVDDGPDVSGETGLRKEFASASGTFEDVRNSYDRVQASTKDPSAAGDLALIFNYMKMLDPASVVRESEFATAANAGSVPDRIRGQYNRVLRGERLAEAQRADFVHQSGVLFDSASERQDGLETYFSELATQYGFDPSRVVREYGGRQGQGGEGDLSAVSDGDLLKMLGQ